MDVQSLRNKLAQYGQDHLVSCSNTETNIIFK